MIFHLVVEREAYEGPDQSPLLKIASINVGGRPDADARPTAEELEALADLVASDMQHKQQGYVLARHFDAMLQVRRRLQEVYAAISHANPLA